MRHGKQADLRQPRDCMGHSIGDAAASMTEAALARAWRERRYAPGGLRTRDGVAVHVVSPGLPNTDRGPDFLDALLVFGDGPLQRGDVEVHLAPPGWRDHGHHNDPYYSGVILHVVAAARGHTTLAGSPILELLPSGGGQETAKGILPLEPLKGQGGGPTFYSSARRPDPGGVRGASPSVVSPACRPTAKALEKLGLARLEARAAAMEGDIAAAGVEQALYEGLLGALGYSKNTAPFREAARLVPFHIVAGIAQGAPIAGAGRHARIAGLLFGAGGLLPSQRARRATGDGHSLSPPRVALQRHEADSAEHLLAPCRDGYVQAIEDAWRTFGGMGVTVPPGSWRMFRVRPDNHPVRRMGSAVALVEGWLRRDLVERLTEAMRASAARTAAKDVVVALTVGPDGYWADHRDFGVTRKGGQAALIGRARAYEMAVSVALPFLLALGDWVRDRALERSVRTAYDAMLAPPQNAMARWAGRHLSPSAGQSGGGKPVEGRGAGVRQQGLLHLVKAGL